MKRPDEFLLKGKRWRIVNRKTLVKRFDCRGYTHYDDPGKRRLIELQTGMNPQEEFEVLLHEMIHATLYEAHLNANSGMSEDAEEIACDAITDMLLSTFSLKWKRNL